MEFRYLFEEALPGLAWCARLVKASETVTVRHGAGVETRKDSFFEGAWNGELIRGQFDQAEIFIGSGGKMTADGLVISAPSHYLERIYLICGGEEFFISNSHVFALVAAQDELDLGYRDYFFDLWRHMRRDLSAPVALPTRKGNRLFGYDSCNLLITNNLAICRKPKNLSPEPENYDQVTDLLEKSLSAVITNAGDPARKRRYRPVTMISTGYDSVAVSAMAAQASCREAVTLVQRNGEGDGDDDDGSTIAGILGMTVTAYDRMEYRNQGGVPEAEFSISGPVNWAPISSMESQLADSLLLTGLCGYDWQQPGRLMSRHHFPPASITEFRLRVGFLLLPGLFAGAVHKRAVRRISCLRDLRPWTVPEAEYNKPILRRIAEESGIPRSLFGWHKRASAFVNLANPANFSTEGYSDFRRFCAENHIDIDCRPSLFRKVVASLSRKATKTADRLLTILPASVFSLVKPYLWPLYPRTSYPLWQSQKALYTFHWGFAHTRKRYEESGGTRNLAER